MMSNLSLETIEKPVTEIEKSCMVDLFHAYCTHKFGSSIWSDLMNFKEFNRMINHFQPIYGDSVFSVLADTVCEAHNIEIKTLLNDFSNFINKYY